MDRKSDSNAALLSNIRKQSKSSARETLVYLAQVAEGSERFYDMCDFMRALIELRVDLTETERNLFATAYKNVAGNIRAAYRAADSNTSNQNQAYYLQDYKNNLFQDQRALSQDALQCLDTMLSVSGLATETKVLYTKLKGDYYRYIAEIDTNSDAKSHANNAYHNAWKMAKSLPNTNCVRLGLALNWSVCHYEVFHDTEKACELAREAFDGAIADLDVLDELAYKDATLILQLLRDNLVLWRTVHSH